MSIFTVVIAVILAFIAYEAYWLTTRARRAVVAGKQVTPATQRADSEAARVLVIGDSTAYGTGASGPAASLAGHLARTYPNFTIENAAFNALNMRQVRERLVAMKGQRFDVVQVHVGGIDTLTFTPAATMRSELRQIFAQARGMGAQLIVLVSVNNVGSAPFFHFPMSALFTYRSRRVSQLCEGLCQEEQVVHVPLFTERSAEPLYTREGVHFAPDSIHPNDSGYRVWFEQINTVAGPHFEAFHNVSK